MVKNFFINLQRQNLRAAQAAAFGQRFLCHLRWSKYTASRGVSDNDPKGSALKALTARNAVFLMSKLKYYERKF